tara:strand:- start:5052 stop:5279 length:228 start_codon:yes stop_codon:yes gene_type:complete
MSSKNVFGAKNGRGQVALCLRRSKQWIGSAHGAVNVGFIDSPLWPEVSVCKVSSSVPCDLSRQGAKYGPMLTLAT